MPYYFTDIDSLENRSAEAMDLAYRYLGRPARSYFRADVRGVENVPNGAALLVGNHSGGLLTPDTFVLYAALYEAFGMEGIPYGLAHEVILRMPWANAFVIPLGAVRASHENAHRVFARGSKSLVYPGGDVDALRPWRDRDRVVFDGRVGYIRLALRERVPIVPVVSAGGHETFIIVDDLKWLVSKLPLFKPFRVKVWPITLSIPWGLTLGPPPIYIPYPSRVIMELLPQITFPRTGPEAAEDEVYVRECADLVEGEMQRTLARLAAERREHSSG